MPKLISKVGPGPHLQHETTGLSEWRQNLYLIGSAVGQRVVLLGDDDTCLKELLSHLEKIGINDKKLISTLHKGLYWKDWEDPLNEVDAFFAAVVEIPTLLGSKATRSDFHWFQLGRAVYEIVSFMSIRQLHDADSNDLQRSIKAARATFEHLMKEMLIPPAIRQDLTVWGSMLDEGDLNFLFDFLNRISLSLYSVL